MIPRQFAKEEGKLKKLIVAIKKGLAKEFLWILFSLLLALPLAFIATYVTQAFGSRELLKTINIIIKNEPLFMYAYAACIGGIYFTRTVAGAIKTLSIKT